MRLKIYRKSETISFVHWYYFERQYSRKKNDLELEFTIQVSGRSVGVGYIEVGYIYVLRDFDGEVQDRYKNKLAKKLQKHISKLVRKYDIMERGLSIDVALDHITNPLLHEGVRRSATVFNGRFEELNCDNLVRDSLRKFIESTDRSEE